jgi:hydrogenase maturation protein HypF
LLDICQINTYEGEAAVLLENYITHYDISSCGSYCSITKDGKIPSQLLLKKLFLAMKNGSSRETLILNFLYTLASLILEIADHFELKEIACSGGVFQNTVLIDMLNELAQNKYRLYFNRNLSPNDENISFGQIMYYLNLKS